MTKEQAEKEIRDTFTKIWADGIIKALEQEPTTKNDLEVDWDELKRKILMEVDGGTDDRWLRYADVCDNISNSIDDFKADLLSVTPQDPKTGHWIEEFNDLEGEVRFTCSSCGKYQLFGTDYCYNCGAKMIQPQESEE